WARRRGPGQRQDNRDRRDDVGRERGAARHRGRDTGATYREFLTQLAQASGIDPPTREDLAPIDRKRPKKGSNDDWTHSFDPHARITKKKLGGRTWHTRPSTRSTWRPA